MYWRISMPHNWVADEAIWEKAKREAEKRGQANNWKYVATLYLKMGGTKKNNAEKAFEEKVLTKSNRIVIKLI